MTRRRAAVLLSVKPRFAEAILSGYKTVELRRRGLDAYPGAAVILYASAPTMAIVGTARLQQVVSLPPAKAWRAHGHTLGITRDEFDAYLDDSPAAVLLLLTKPQRLNQPISLAELRNDASRFQPPQSYRFVAASDPAPLRQLITAP